MKIRFCFLHCVELIAKFIDVAIGNKVEMMLEHANEKSARIMDNAAIHDVFGL